MCMGACELPGQRKPHHRQAPAQCVRRTPPTHHPDGPPTFGRVEKEEADVDELPIGRRVAYWRTRRKMSQQVFAGRLGKSKSWVDKVERGVRRLDKFSVVYEIADVLQVDVQLLLGKDVERRPETQNCKIGRAHV